MLEYLFYCDESGKEGRYFSNFYGGIVIKSTDIDEIRNSLDSRKNSLDLNELKWQRVSQQYLNKYLSMMELFFDWVKQNKIKVRIMFTQNARYATGLTKEQRDNTFFILYYLFMKHAFGLQYSNPNNIAIGLRFHFDQFPDTKSKVDRFVEFIHNLQFIDDFNNLNFSIKKENIVEIDSKKHVVLQCLDVVLGAMFFRLNDLHREIPVGKRRRGKRTIAKETLYKYINNRIREVYPNFNIGASTGHRNNIANRWMHPYRHWLFIPSEHIVDFTKCKPK